MFNSFKLLIMSIYYSGDGSKDNWNICSFTYIKNVTTTKIIFNSFYVNEGRLFKKVIHYKHTSVITTELQFDCSCYFLLNHNVLVFS